ncbi:MAG: hypothetical protein ABI295_05285 [Xanthomarina sp.]
MGKLILLLVFIGITSVSCDGRDRTYKTNYETLKQGKLLNSFSEKISYIPETYTEIISDTILSNGFRIKMKTYSNMEQSVLNEFKQDALKHKVYYREFVSEVIITKNSIEIFNKTIDKLFLDRLKNDLQLNNAIVKLRLDQSYSIASNTIVLSVMIEKIDDKKITFCDLIIDSEGAYKLKEVHALYAYIN